MDQIASLQDLQKELQNLLAYCQDRAPSRSRLASELKELADRVAEIKTPPGLGPSRWEDEARQAAYNVAKTLKNADYVSRLTRGFAQTYFELLDKVNPPSIRVKGAGNLIDALDSEIDAAESTIKVFQNQKALLEQAVKAHESLAKRERYPNI